MSAAEKAWFAASPAESAGGFRCASCGSNIAQVFPSLDHHPRACPVCGAESVFLSLPGASLQILPGRAPPELARALRWAQGGLDELEFVQLLVSLEEIAEAVRAGVPTAG
jgi:hypothetical protein